MPFIKANLVSYNKIDVFVSDLKSRANSLFFKLYKNESEIVNIKNITHPNNGEDSIFSIETSEKIELGNSYTLCVSDFSAINVDVSSATEFPDFDKDFYYDGDDLGALYSSKQTKFALWAPLASQVILKLEDGDDFKLLKMKREHKGVYKLTVKGDLLNKKYHYLVTNNGVQRETNDPYGKGVSLNSEYSAVVDYSSLLKNKRYLPQNKIKNYVDAIIYETNVRDFTESKATNIKEKGKYLGFVEENRKTKGGNPAGIDYLTYLGVTHVQLNPICDFDNVKDDNVSKSYNWGYDPLSHFAIEGSYSSDPKNPSKRLEEFSFMVEQLHKRNIRTIVDVVFNHVYEYQTSTYEKVVPNYFFRKSKNRKIANASGCGNDFASERLMARKLIIDSAKYLIKYFNVDGLRFDLMGLIDLDTINLLVKECKNIKNDLMFYGEGWNMGLELPMSKKACSENHDLIPDVAFFNDTFRDIIKGPNGKENLNVKGYINGDVNYVYGLDYILHGCIKDTSYKPKFSNANQTINYAECHDNNTLFDKLLISNKDESEQIRLRRVRLANDFILSCFGIPFFHMGQEIGLSKEGLDNTYNIPKINNMDWELVDERFEMVNHFKLRIEIRKVLNFTKLHSIKDIDNIFKIEHWDNGIYCAAITNEKYSYPYKEILILINPTNKQISYELDDYYTLMQSINFKDKITMKQGIMPNVCLSIFYR